MAIPEICAYRNFTFSAATAKWLDAMCAYRRTIEKVRQPPSNMSS
jgi:hypothetical protein